MAYFFRKSDQKNRYNEVGDADLYKEISSEPLVDQEIFGYLKVQLPKGNKLFLKTGQWVIRYCFLSKFELLISKSEKFRSYEKGSFQCKIPCAISMRVFQSVERMNSNKKQEKLRWKFMPPRFIEIIDESKRKFRLSFTSDDEMNYWLSALFKAFNKTHVEQLTNKDITEEFNGKEELSEHCQPESLFVSKAVIPPIPAPRISKNKLLAGAMEEEKQTKLNEEYKKVMESRVDILVDRRNELTHLLKSDEKLERCDFGSEKKHTQAKRSDSLVRQIQSELQSSYLCNCRIESEHQEMMKPSVKSDSVSTEIKPLVSKNPISAPLYPLCFTKMQKPNEFANDSVYLWSLLSEPKEKLPLDSTMYDLSSEKLFANLPKMVRTSSVNSDKNKEDAKIAASKVEFCLDKASKKHSTCTQQHEISDIAKDLLENAKIISPDCRISPILRPKICKQRCISCGCDSKCSKTEWKSKNRIRNLNFFNEFRNAFAQTDRLVHSFNDDLANGDERRNVFDGRFRHRPSAFMKKMHEMYDSKSSLGVSSSKNHPWLKVQGTCQFTSNNGSASPKRENAKMLKLPEFERPTERSLFHVDDHGKQKCPSAIDCKLCRAEKK